jgi:hypothetical protein
MYLPAAAGVGFSSHYCFGKLKETKVFSVEKQHCCCDTEEEEENDCCRNEIKVVKLDKDQLTSGQNSSLKAKTVDLFYVPIRSGFQGSTCTSIKGLVTFLKSPPKPPCNRIIQYCTFLI